jgi:hypothetical protein
MATRITRTLVDDLDESTDNVGTYRFAWQGVEIEIDLSAANFDTLSSALAPYIGAGRRLRRTSGGVGNATSAAKAARAGIRTWWAANAEKLDLPPHRGRGAIPAAVTNAYDASR